MNQPFLQYPAEAGCNSDILLSQLGYFWNSMFKDKKALQGLTFAQAEQTVQQYYQLAETVASLSGATLPVFNRVKWYPLVVKQSEINHAPVTFGDGSIWGVQAGDSFYGAATYQFGQPKGNTSNLKLYSWRHPAELKSFALIGDHIVNPLNCLIKGVDCITRAGALILKTNPFELSGIQPVALFNQDGTVATYRDSNNIERQDSFVVLWAYQAEVERSAADRAYGWLFNLHQPSSERYCAVLSGLLQLGQAGPSVNHVKAAVAAFLGVRPVVETGEVVEAVYSYQPDGYLQPNTRVVQTNLNCYRADAYYNVAAGIKVGSVLTAGDVLFDAVEYYDVVEDRGWWRTKIVPKISYNNIDSSTLVKTPGMSFQPAMFACGPVGELAFKNDMELFTRDADGGYHFPVEGSAADVARFNDYLGLADNAVGTACGLAPGGTILVNPLDFLFDNFLKSGSALIKINFKNIDQAALFTTAFHHIKQSLPRNVLFIFFMDFAIPADELALLNNNTTVLVHGDELTRSIDGSDTNGFMTVDPDLANYRENVKTRLFSLSQGVTTTQMDVNLNSGAGDMTVRDGGMLTPIADGQTTREVGNLLLMSFS